MRHDKTISLSARDAAIRRSLVVDRCAVTRFVLGVLVLRACLLIGLFSLAILSSTSITFAEKTAEQAADDWVGAQAEKQANAILRDVEKKVPLDPNVKSNLKDTIKGLLKDKLKSSFLPKPPTLAMESILHAIRDSLKDKGRGKCQALAADRAWYATDVSRVGRGALETIINLGESLLGVPGLVKKLGGSLLKELGKEGLDRLRKALEEALDNYLKNYKIETFSESKNVGECSVLVRVVWNKAKGTFNYAIIGDCGCKLVAYRSRGKKGEARISRWSVTGRGTAKWVGEATEKKNAKSVTPTSSIKGRASVSAPRIKAPCCKDGKPGPEDPWTFVDPPKKEAQVCKPPEFVESDPDYLAAWKDLGKTNPAKYSGRVTELEKQFEKAKCRDKAKILRKMYALLKAFQDKRAEMAREGFKSVVNKISKAIEELGKAIDEANEKLEKCGKKHCLNYDSSLQTEEYAYAVQTIEECVATTYYYSGTTVTEETIVTQTEEGIGVTEGEPVTVGVPAEGVPVCTRTPPTTVTPTPEGDKPSPTTVTKTPQPEEEDEPDLGLVKAKETVVLLALKGDTTDKPYEGAAVKFLEKAPPLRLSSDVDPALTSIKAYTSDVAAGFSSKDGTVTLSLAPKENAKQVKEQSVEESPITLREVRIDEDKQKKGRLVVTMKADKAGANSSNNKPGLPASLAKPGFNLCIAHSFRIGNQAVFIASLAKSAMKQFERTVSQLEGVYSVEIDPCRKKE